MKIALVRHVDVGGVDTLKEVRDLVVPVAQKLAEDGFRGTNTGLYTSPKAYPCMTANHLRELNNLPDPVTHMLLDIRNGTGGDDLGVLLKTSFRSIFPDFRDGIVLVTHEPVIATITGKRRINYGEITVMEVP